MTCPFLLFVGRIEAARGRRVNRYCCGAVKRRIATTSSCAARKNRQHLTLTRAAEPLIKEQQLAIVDLGDRAAPFSGIAIMRVEGPGYRRIPGAWRIVVR